MVTIYWLKDQVVKRIFCAEAMTEMIVSIQSLERAAAHSVRYLSGLRERPVRASAGLDELRAALGAPLDERGVDPRQVVDDLAAAAEPGLVATAGPRYFGFVIGGSVPAALAADWLAATWDQNAGLVRLRRPSAAVVEEVAAGWLLDLLRLPTGASVGFVTGGQMANFTGLIAAARHARAARAPAGTSRRRARRRAARCTS